MPTSKFSNAVYQLRIKIPVRVPRSESHPDLEILGCPLYTKAYYEKLLKKHHVLGSAALLRDHNSKVRIISSSRNPVHIVHPGSFFRVASITKMVTSLCVMISVEKGVLSLNAPFLSYFPELSGLPDLKGITPLHLLSHTSGLRDPANLEISLFQKKEFPEILNGTLQSIPGAEFHYSNLGYGLLGSLLESIWNMPISDIFNHLVFKPLNMRATLDASQLNPSEIVPITRIYPWKKEDLIITPLGRIPLLHPDPLRHYGHTAGAMYLDLDSLEKLILCLMQDGHPLIQTDLGKRMKQKQASYGKLSPTLSYGLGILRIEDPSLSSSPILGHQGFAYGCADGAFWEADTGRMLLFLNGGASEARKGRLGLCNYDLLRWSLRKEFPKWSLSLT